MRYNSAIKLCNNAAIDTDVSILDAIHQEHINIAIQERELQNVEKEIQQFLDQDVCLRMSGTANELIGEVGEVLAQADLAEGVLFQDFKYLLRHFERISQSDTFKVYFATVKTDMCRRFHTDVNTIRLLCTYYGAGTLWLPEENANREAHHTGEGNDSIVKDPALIQQANAGDIVLLKGALYPNAKAIIHKSPSVEAANDKRLLLRIDMNNSLKFI